MLTITIFAAGLVCLAGVLSLRLGRAQVATATAQASTDERGITLQTLIVTAVLVLMAVAAGVVIVAITNNAAEDLEESAPSVETACNSVEVFDPILASRGAVGVHPDRLVVTNADVASGVAGCVPVCYTAASSSVTASKDAYSVSGAKLADASDMNVAVPFLGLRERTGTSPNFNYDTKLHTLTISPPSESRGDGNVSVDLLSKICFTDRDGNGNPVDSSAHVYRRP